MSRARLLGARARFETVAQHVGLDRQHDDRADGDHLEIDVDVVQVQRVADHADHHRADQRMADMAASAEETRPADDHGGDRVELQEIAVERRATRRSGRSAPPRRCRRKGPKGHRPRPARRLTGNAHPARRLGRAADGIEPAAPDHRPASATKQQAAPRRPRRRPRPGRRRRAGRRAPRWRRACRASWCGPARSRAPGRGRWTASPA